MGYQSWRLYQVCRFFLLVLGVGLGGFTEAAELTMLQQQFLAAKTMLAKGDRAQFLQLAQSLQDYPLYPYLQYADLQQRLATASMTDIEHFLQTYRDTPLAGALRKQWLLVLGQQQHWSEVLSKMPETHDQELNCLRRRAALALGDTQQAFAGLTPLSAKL